VFEKTESRQARRPTGRAPCGDRADDKRGVCRGAELPGSVGCQVLLLASLSVWWLMPWLPPRNLRKAYGTG
jgi:hypothetical protein